MTHHQQVNAPAAFVQQEPWPDETPASWQDLLELLCEHGFEGMAQAMQLLINEAMKLERTAVLGAQPFERTPLRRGRANGFKPKTVETRLGPLELRVPQTRDVPFYPRALERGQRSERALKLAIAEMYLQGVSTRKVTAVMEELCGLEVTSSQVSRAVQTLDTELTQWRERATPRLTVRGSEGTVGSNRSTLHPPPSSVRETHPTPKPVPARARPRRRARRSSHTPRPGTSPAPSLPRR